MKKITIFQQRDKECS